MKSSSRSVISKGLEITKNRIVRDLRKIGIEEGDNICVHSSLKSIGYVDGGPETLIDALLEVVGPNGTIMMPAFTRHFHISRIMTGKVDYIFDYKLTPTWTGLVSETFRNRKDVIRSKHPTNSIAAIGKMAKYLTKGHDENSNSYEPYSRLAEIGGKILCIGIGDRIVAIRHEAQHVAGLLDIVPTRFGVKYRDDDGTIKIFVRRGSVGCTKRLPEFNPILKKMGFIKEDKIGNAKSVLIPAKNLIEVMSKMLRSDPTLNLCDYIGCFWCRELERRLNLYKKIESPKFFQKNSLIIKTIALINWLRFRNYFIDEIIQFIGNAIQLISNIIIKRKNFKEELSSAFLNFKLKRSRRRELSP